MTVDTLQKPMRGPMPDPKYPTLFPRLYSDKLDGIRAMVQQGQAVTKSLKPIPSKFVRDWLVNHIPNGFDGELIVGEPNVEDVYSKTYSGVMTKAAEPDFRFHVFDLMLPKLTAYERYKQLQVMVSALPAEVQARIVVVQKELVHDAEGLAEAYADSLERGYEGGMSQDVTGEYVHGKASPKQQQMLKHKPEDDVEGEILELIPAYENRNAAFTNELGRTARSTHAENKVQKNQLGAFLVRQLDGSGNTKVAAGKMKHDERDEVWAEHMADPTKYIGKLIKFRKMAYGMMANDAARHGRWIGWVDVTDLSIPDAVPV